MLQTPSFSARLMACKVLHDSQSTLSHPLLAQGRVSGQDHGKFEERGCCGWRTLGNFFHPLHVAMVHQSLPS